MDVENRVVGGVLGLALGDALGAPFEFQRAHRIPRPVPAFELSWKGLPPGSTTDDTAMARNLARSLAARGGFDADELVARHLEWFRSDPPDVGTLTRRVLGRVVDGADAREAARAVWKERGPELSAGNGSVMYCGPLGLAYAHRAEELARVAPELSALTHSDERCRTAVLAITTTAAALVRREAGERAAREGVDAALALEGGEELEFLVDAAGASRPVDGPDQGFCLFTAGLALQALIRGGSFEDELLRVVGLGGDTDTNAAVAGVLLGARDGADALPEAWLDRLQDAHAIRAEAEALAPLGALSSSAPSTVPAPPAPPAR